jgi:hypothetical protein
MRIAEDVGSEWLGCCVTNASKPSKVFPSSSRSIRVDDAQNAWLPGHANTDPDIRFWWLFEEGPRAVFSLEVDEFRDPRATLSAFWQFRPYHLHDEGQRFNWQTGSLPLGIATLEPADAIAARA